MKMMNYSAAVVVLVVLFVCVVIAVLLFKLITMNE